MFYHFLNSHACQCLAAKNDSQQMMIRRSCQPCHNNNERKTMIRRSCQPCQNNNEKNYDQAVMPALLQYGDASWHQVGECRLTASELRPVSIHAAPMLGALHVTLRAALAIFEAPRHHHHLDVARQAHGSHGSQRCLPDAFLRAMRGSRLA